MGGSARAAPAGGAVLVPEGTLFTLTEPLRIFQPPGRGMGCKTLTLSSHRSVTAGGGRLAFDNTNRSRQERHRLQIVTYVTGENSKTPLASKRLLSKVLNFTLMNLSYELGQLSSISRRKSLLMTLSLPEQATVAFTLATEKHNIHHR